MEQITDPATARTTPDADQPPFAEQPPFNGQPPLAEPPRAARPAFRLRRSRTDRMLAGVCGGLAESLNVDPALMRVGMVALTVIGAGVPVVVYAAVWLIAPETDAP
ncbi:PspC domain-containing protein [Pseudonocardia sp. CA-142604]|uniref:PspC domain-containing protein n=1 Tax=Pseudonocardia sp. CA-142604 TaxID=3240024 RepID=UPI003D8F1717